MQVQGNRDTGIPSNNRAGTTIFFLFFFSFSDWKTLGVLIGYQRRIRTSYDNFCGAFIGVSTVITYRSIESDTARETREIVASSISEIGRPSKKKRFLSDEIVVKG